VAVVALITAACGSSSPSTTATTLAPSPAGAAATTTKPAAGTTVAKAVSNATIGKTILVNTSGMTLYTLSADTAATSSCSAACASIWPPLTVGSGMTPAGTGTGGTLATITRSDGSLQVTFNGRPLYTFVGDKSAGSTSGNGIKSFGGTWSVVSVGATTAGNSPSGTTAPTPATTKAPSGGYSY
jgi:predicted lipoprotein with Yx(FWY)xxD motif